MAWGHPLRAYQSIHPKRIASAAAAVAAVIHANESDVLSLVVERLG